MHYVKKSWYGHPLPHSNAPGDMVKWLLLYGISEWDIHCSKKRQKKKRNNPIYICIKMYTFNVVCWYNDNYREHFKIGQSQKHNVEGKKTKT